MLKLLICLFGTFAVAVVMLQLRQQQRDLNYQANALHNKIESQQAKLWSQQLRIASWTAPNALANTVTLENLNLVPQTPVPTIKGWISPTDEPPGQ